MNSLSQHIFESQINEADESERFVLCTGSSFRSLWNNSSPSVSYDKQEIFLKKNEALAAVKNFYKTSRSVKTTMGQGGIPGGFTTYVADLYLVSSDVDPSDWSAPYKIPKDTRKIAVSSTGKDAEKNELFKQQLLAYRYDLAGLVPDEKDLKRAESLVDANANWTMKDNQAMAMLVSITDPKKFIKRWMAMILLHAKSTWDNGIQYSGGEKSKGVDVWLSRMYTIGGIDMHEFERKMAKKYGQTILQYVDLDDIRHTIIKWVKPQLK